MEVYRGDIFYIEDNFKTEGSEQRPGRPALVVSNNTGNHHSNIVSIVWLTTAEKKICQHIARFYAKSLQQLSVSRWRQFEMLLERLIGA